MKYIGIDVHRRQCTYVVLGKGNRILQRGSVPTTEKDLEKLMLSIKGKKKVAFEEGPLAQWLYVVLLPIVDELVVGMLPERHGAKNDRIDAYEIADLLRVGRLKTVFHSDSEFINLRALVTAYANVIKNVIRAKNQYKAIFARVGIVLEGTHGFKNKELLDELQDANYRFIAEHLQEQIAVLEMQRQHYVGRFEHNAEMVKEIGLLKSIPGIGAIRANQLVAIIVTPYRFPTKYKFFSYAMLTGHIQTSDGKFYGKQKTYGNSTLKSIFKTGAYTAIRSDTAFKKKYEQMIASGSNKRSAQNAIGKKLAATVLGVWKSGKSYNDNIKEETLRSLNVCHNMS